MLFLILALTLLYAGLLFYFILGAQRLYKKHPAQVSDLLPFISIVVPLRNEETTAAETLEALSVQDYDGQWEVICVDDRSTDGTRPLLEKFCATHERFRVLAIRIDEPGTASPKKRALARGFAAAAGDILMTTDADCTPPPGWLSSMAKNFTEPIGIVQGPKRVTGPNDFLTRYQKLEVFGFVSIEAATFAMGKPMLASAPSLAYRKSLYEKAGGFAGMEHLVSGDDDMLVHKMTEQEGGNVRYNLDKEACVSTVPVTNWPALVQQRARWASNGYRYSDKRFVALLAGIFAFYFFLLTGPLLAMGGLIPWSWFLIPLGIKVLLEYVFLYQTSVKFSQKRLIADLVWAELVHVPLIVVSVVMGLFGWYKWK
ncbi:glycosyltransferase [Fibrobacterota bacterium]